MRKAISDGEQVQRERARESSFRLAEAGLMSQSRHEGATDSGRELCLSFMQSQPEEKWLWMSRELSRTLGIKLGYRHLKAQNVKPESGPESN
jgi:hypothetical protein